MAYQKLPEGMGLELSAACVSASHAPLIVALTGFSCVHYGINWSILLDLGKLIQVDCSHSGILQIEVKRCIRCNLVEVRGQ